VSIATNTREKLRGIIAQIDQLLLSDIPHSSTADGLGLFREFFRKSEELVDRAQRTGQPNILLNACMTANERISTYLPFLGFLLRSTNVRNSFESFDILAELAVAIIGPQSKVIIWSEWDFSPLTYALSVSVLPNYILIGMPASESGNALVLPLAGHELGHSVWVNDGLETKNATAVERSAREFIKRNDGLFKQAFPEHAHLSITDDEIINNMFISQTVANIVSCTLGQLEETFCDAVGLALFGKSFVYAFHYLLAPGVGGQRDPYYPPLHTRALFMRSHGALDFGELGFTSFEMEFSSQRLSQSGPKSDFVIGAADHITNDFAPKMYSDARNSVVTKATNMLPDKAVESEIIKLYSAGMPAKSPKSLANILNAGWEFVVKNDFESKTGERPLFEWVSELIFKTIEVFEYERRLNA